MSADLKRQVKIKTGIVKRLRKELAMYEQEKVQNDKRVEDMRASGADTYDIRQAERVADESAMMIPDCKGRFDAAFSDLEKLVVRGTVTDRLFPRSPYQPPRE
uniref:Tubulin-specific chaperone A n=1 Tax=Phaeocystis cordata TaxID=118079 RepID=A0A7S1MZS0_9EUKA|mmetsp:Transcript_7066/g.17390  ORF Transcript_7066/g.17390 Transcript_7066/m.17390 type:complete len:103 (+) Transcript_7066:105-413(+)